MDIKKKVFFFDVDDTLLPVKLNSHVSIENVKAIKKLKENPDNDIYIATGKSWEMIKNVREQLQISNAITSNGQNIKIKNEIIYEKFFKKNDVLKLQQYLKQNFSGKNLIVGCQEELGNYVLSENNEPYKKYVHDIFTKLSVPVPKPQKEILDTAKISQIWILGEVEDISLENFEIETKLFRWNQFGFDVLPKNSSKAKAIKYLLNTKYRNQKIETYAFGDGLNDIEMFELVDNSIAVDNAKEIVKKSAKYITDSCENSGVSKFLIKKKLI